MAKRGRDGVGLVASGGLLDWLRAAFALSLPLTAVLMLAVARGWTARLDDRIIAAAHHRPAPRADGKPARLTTALRDLTALGGDTLRLLFLLGCAAGLVAAGRIATAAALVGIFAVARAALFVLKAIVRRPRPRIGTHDIVTFTSSFPSGHTFMAVVLFLSAAILIPAGSSVPVIGTGIAFALVTSLAIGLTRMAFGIHWPSDILAGWLAGIAWTSGCLLLLARVGSA